jgi:hypothetical protein
VSSEVEICNDALAMIGHEPFISSLDQAGKTAGLCKVFYPRARDELLRSHPWNFATRRAEIAASTSTPAWGYDSSYPLPSDCLRVLGLDGHPATDWRLEGKAIVCNETAPLNVLYVAQVTDPEQFDASFSRALAGRLAVDLCMPLANNIQMRTAVADEAKARLREARGIDAQETASVVPWADTFIEPRY